MVDLSAQGFKCQNRRSWCWAVKRMGGFPVNGQLTLGCTVMGLNGWIVDQTVEIPRFRARYEDIVVDPGVGVTV